jgi:hypothetical protein
MTIDIGDIKTTFHNEYIVYYQAEDTPTFNATHLSKYVTDYQKIQLHYTASKVCKPENLLAINTDSITFIGSYTPNQFWKIEAQGDTFQGSNGFKRILSQGEIVYSRGQIQHPLPEFTDNRIYATATDYSTDNENTPLPNQHLRTVFAAAGYGKSELSKYITGQPSKFEESKHARRYKPEECLTVATTHVARKLINGTMTLAMLLIRLKHGMSLNGIKMILIDEISMMSDKNLDYLDSLLRRSNNRPFGGLDIYLVGHLKQLPVPEEGSEPITASKHFKHFQPIHLTKNYRHDDEVYAQILGKIERYYDCGGDIRSNHKAKLVLPKILTKNEFALLQTRKTPKLKKGTDITPIHFTNRAVAQSNKILAEFIPGAEVIVRFNAKRKGGNLNNGDRHIIQEVNGSAIKFNDQWFSKDFYTKQKDEKFPRIQLSASFTIHCSQGQTLKKVFIYPRGLTMNLLYVAMSRVRRLSDLYIGSL